MEVRVVIQRHRGTMGGITERLWLSQAAAHLCYFCLCDDILAVPILLIFFFFFLFSQAQSRNSIKIISCEKQRVKEGGENTGKCLCYPNSDWCTEQNPHPPLSCPRNLGEAAVSLQGSGTVRKPTAHSNSEPHLAQGRRSRAYSTPGKSETALQPVELQVEEG